MSFTEELLSGFGAKPKFCSMRKKGRYVTGSARFSPKLYSEILEHINRKIEPVIKNGEKIVCDITQGEIIDCGVKQFHIDKGIFIEVYDYSKTTAIFLRLYVISSGEDEWLALYVDENPSTPWWSKEK